ncbi:MAG: hypothetical protein KDJ16_06830 [Hyphomicrobiales bacterium]|nr:hypothetical protein [Amphiplicatus sp.]MCC2111731.1 hypothetical protein [Hyphomicrobiales bacterium]
MSHFTLDDVARIALANSDAARELSDQIAVMFGLLHSVIAELEGADPGVRERIVARASNALAGRGERVTALASIIMAGLWSEPDTHRPPALQ